MLKNKHNNHQNFSYSLKKDFETSKKPLCVLVKDNNEAVYLKNELSLLIGSDEILLFPENDILPYDHEIFHPKMLYQHQLLFLQIIAKRLIQDYLYQIFLL